MKWGIKVTKMYFILRTSRKISSLYLERWARIILIENGYVGGIIIEENIISDYIGEPHLFNVLTILYFKYQNLLYK